MLALFLLYVFLVWIFSRHDLFQVIGTDASCVLCIICFWLNLIVQFTSEFSLSFADLCKVSIEDGDHVIS